jgi:hypothetical protein
VALLVRAAIPPPGAAFTAAPVSLLSPITDRFATGLRTRQPRRMSEIRLFKASNSPECELPDDTRLWRYVPLKTLFVYLNNKVFIPSIETLRKQDPFEGEFYHNAFPRNFDASLDRWLGSSNARELREWIARSDLNVEGPHEPYANSRRVDHSIRLTYFDILRHTRFAWCWFEASEDTESAAMWNLYGKDGAAIGTTVGALKTVLADSSTGFEFGRMTYVHVDQFGKVVRSVEPQPDQDDPFTELILRPHFLKRQEYGSENEVRFITSSDVKSAGGIELGLPAYQWIKEIRLWPKLELSEETVLIDAIRRVLPEVPCRRSGLIRRKEDDELDAIADKLSLHIHKALFRLWPIASSDPNEEASLLLPASLRLPSSLP